MASPEILVLKIQLDAEATIKTTDDLIKRNKELAKLIRQAPREGEEGFAELEGSIKKAKDEFARNREEITKFNRSLREVEVPTDSLKGMSRQLRQMEEEYKKLSKAEREAFGKEQQEAIHKLREELKEQEAALGDFRRNVGNYSSVWESAGNVIKGVGVAAAAALTFETLKDAAARVGEVTEEFRNLRGTIQTFTGATGTDLDDFAVGVQTISQTFQKTNEEVTLAANTLSKEFGIGFAESLDLIEKGILAGADANGEFLSGLSEYSTQFKAAGFEGEQLIEVLTRQATSGIFSDKGVDTVKEFGLRIREQTKATSDALIGAFGENFTDELFEGINNGSITTSEALSRVSTAIDEVNPNAKNLQTVIADVFGGAGEDAGIEFIKSLKEVGGNIEALIDTDNELVAAQLRQIKVEEELARAQNETAKRFSDLQEGSGLFFKQLETLGFSVLNGIFDLFVPLQPLFQQVQAAFVRLAESFGFVSKESGGVFQAVKDFLIRPFKILAGIVEVLSNAFIFLVDQFIALRQNVPIIDRIFQAVAERIQTTIRSLENIPSFFVGLVAAVRQAGNNIQDFFARIARSAEIFSLRLKDALTIDREASDQIKSRIQELKKLNQESRESGKTVGEAFTEAFEESVLERDLARASVSESLKDSKPAEEAGKASGAAYGEAAAKEATKEFSAGFKPAPDFDEGSIEFLKNQVKILTETLEKSNLPAEKFEELTTKIRIASERLAEAEKKLAEATETPAEAAARIQKEAEEKQKAADAATKKALDEQKKAIDIRLEQAKTAASEERLIAIDAASGTAEDLEQIQKDFENKVLDAERKALEERRALLGTDSAEAIKIQKQIADQEFAIRKDLYDKDVEAAKEAEEKKKELRDAAVGAALEAAQMIADAAFEIANQNAEREKETRLSALEGEFAERLAAVEGNAFAEERILAEKTKREQAIEQDAARKRKRNAILQAIINSALAATTTLANLGLPAAIPALIDLAITSAVQIAVISAQKLAKGGRLKKMSSGGIAGGRKHSEGGNPGLVDGTTPIEFERDEAIITAPATGAFVQTLSDINQAGGGVKFYGTARLTPERLDRIRLVESMARDRPILAKKGLSPRIPYRSVQRFQEGGIASVTSQIEQSAPGLTSEDLRNIEKAVERGAKTGIEKANITEQIRRQSERESSQQINSFV